MLTLWNMRSALKSSKKIMNQYFKRTWNSPPFTKFDALFTGPCFLQYCINEKYLARFSTVSWAIRRGENSLFRSLSKSPFARHLPFLGAGNLVLSDKILFKKSLRQWRSVEHRAHWCSSKAPVLELGLQRKEGFLPRRSSTLYLIS